MREFRSLNPEDLPKDFNAEAQGEEPIIDLKESEGKIIISYTFPGFYLIDAGCQVDGEKLDFKLLNIEGTGYLAESGKPLLPSFGRYVQIPSLYDYEYSVEKKDQVQFDEIVILPSQENVSDGPQDDPSFEFDKELYQTDVFYPEKMVKVTGPFEIDGYHALLVHVTPFQYNPAKKKLVGYGKVTLTLDLVPKEGEEKIQSESPVDREAFGNLFLNPGRKIEERLNIEPKEIPIPLRRSGAEFLIIYADIFSNAAKKLANWKNKRGITTEIISIDKIGNDVSKIKNHIRKLKSKKSSNLRYVLLFGDEDMIAAEEPVVTSTSGPWGENISDYYYSTPNDPTGDKELIFPWISVGRIPMRTADQGMEVVDQIITYEKNPPTDSNYYKRMSFAAFFQGTGQTDERGFLKTMENDIRPTMLSLGFDVERIYVSQSQNPKFYYDGIPIPADVIAAIVDGTTATNRLVNATSQGKLYVGHRDHGAPEGWVHPEFTVNDLDKITGDMPSMFFSINCLTGSYDLPAPSESFAEKNLRIKGTAPSLIAASRVSHSWLNNDLMKALFDGTFGGVLPTYPGTTASYPVKFNRLGDLLNYAKSYLPVGQSGSAEYIKDHFEIYHVIGDPTLELWKSEPLIIELVVQLLFKLKKPVLDIQLTQCPQGAVLSIYKNYHNKEDLITIIKPSSTHITVPLKDLIPIHKPNSPLEIEPEIFVGLWAPGYRYVEEKLNLEEIIN